MVSFNTVLLAQTRLHISKRRQHKPVPLDGVQKGKISELKVGSGIITRNKFLETSDTLQPTVHAIPVRSVH